MIQYYKTNNGKVVQLYRIIDSRLQFFSSHEIWKNSTCDKQFKKLSDSGELLIITVDEVLNIQKLIKNS